MEGGREKAGGRVGAKKKVRPGCDQRPSSLAVPVW